MRVLLFGATGMVGQGVLRECLLAEDVERVTAVGRRSTGLQHAKLREVPWSDLASVAALEPELAGHDACFWCLGTSAAGKREAEYTRLTYDPTMAVARTLARLEPGMTFVFVSGAGTDGTQRSAAMWARVKGRTENALLALGLRAAFMFRPALIQPVHGERSRTTSYRVLYVLLRPLFGVLASRFPGSVTTTERFGRAMLNAARHGAPRRILESQDIDALATHR